MKRQVNYKVGIIGAGGIVTNVHLPVLRAFPNIEIDWIVDADFSVAQRVGKAYGVQPIPLPNNLSNLPEADVYVIAAPYGARSPYLEILGRRSASVYIEKPFAKTLKEHETICSHFSSHKIADGYQKRSWGPTAYIRDLLHSGIFGRLKCLRFEVGEPRTSSSRYPGAPLLGGGGLLMEIGCHGIDFALFVVEAVDVHLESGHMISEGGYDLHSNGSFLIETSSLGSIRFEIVISNLKPTANCCSLEFDLASVDFSLFTWSGLRVKHRAGYQSILDSAEQLLPLSPYQNFFCHWREFFKALETGVPNYANAAQSKLTAKALGLLYARADGVWEPILP